MTRTQSNSNRSTRRLGLASLWLALLGGCVAGPTSTALPSKTPVVRDQLVVHADFKIAKRHRLLDELAARRNDVANLLSLPLSDEPIHVYLFENRKRYEAFLQEHHPDFPDRRAFFVKTDTELKVYAYWGERVAEDLRHEVSHGYLHSTVPNLPLWLDEGMAEYFESPRGANGFNQSHVYLLANAFRRGEWQPDLQALEALEPRDQMNQMQYAESWLWVHFLVHRNATSREILKSQLQQLQVAAVAPLLSTMLADVIDDPENELIEHLRKQAEKM